MKNIIKESEPINVSVPRMDIYPIRIRLGLLDELPNLLNNVDHYVIATDTVVHELYGKKVIESLKEIGNTSNINCFIIPTGEKSKSLEIAESFYNSLLDFGTRRRSLLVALGGGVITDVVGFVASTFMRGLSYINIPTTLIAQADASIGGKTAVNHARGKNLIGAFWHPTGVFIDPSVLRTLPLREIRNGLAEVLKIAIISSPDLFIYLENHYAAIIDKQTKDLEIIITEAVREKINLLSDDPYENNLKRSLNFGHTLGHPLETLYNYSELLHGEAIAIGMYIATEVARQRQLCSERIAKRIFTLLIKLCLPLSLPKINSNELWKHLQIVRKIRNNQLHFVLPVDIGQVTFVEDLTINEIRAALKKLKSEEYR